MRGRASRGFTLVEVAIVVVIVAILSVLGIVSYRRYVANAHMAEATNMTGNIRAAQEAHKAETGVYAKVSNTANAYYPAASPGKFVTQWGGPCSNCVKPNAWDLINVKSAKPVIFGYSAYSGLAGTDAMALENAPTEVAASTAKVGQLPVGTPYYVSIAYGDTNGDSIPCYVEAASWSNELVVASPGE